MLIIDENMLVLHRPGSAVYEVLAKSLLKGGCRSHNTASLVAVCNFGRARLATVRDMVDFEILPQKYIRDGIEYAKVVTEIRPLSELFLLSDADVDSYQDWINGLIKEYEAGGGVYENVEELFKFIRDKTIDK